MKKKSIIVLALCLICAFALCACGGSSEPLKLDGEWASEKNDGSNMEATISGETIEIYWVTEDTKSLYWSGSVTVPGENVLASDEYTWTSKANAEKNDAALLASSSDSKEFKYSEGKIVYEVSALGTTTTMKLSRKK